MKAIRLFKNGMQTNEGRFESEEECLQWLARGNQEGWWQTEDRTEVIPAIKEMREVEIQPEIKDEDGNVIQERVIELQEVVIREEETIIHPATHTYEIIDITREVEEEKKRILVFQAYQKNLDKLLFSISKGFRVTKENALSTIENLFNITSDEKLPDVDSERTH